MKPSVCMLVHHYFPRDVRVRREARALAAAGYRVTVVALSRAGEPASEEWQGIRILRMPIRRHRGRPLPVYLAEYLAMTGLAGATLAGRLPFEDFDVVHVHTPPDFLVAAGLPGRLRGAKLVVDIHDLSPELYAERFGTGGGRALRAMLEATERIACRLADRVVTVTDAFAQRLKTRGVPDDKLVVVRNCPDEELFDPDRVAPAGRGPGLRVVHHGTLVHRYGVDVLLEAFARVAAELPEARLDVYGEGDAEGDLRARAERADLAGRVAFHGDVLQDELVAGLAAADLCVVPNRADAFTDLLMPTKLLEALRMGVAAVASATSAIAGAFSPGEVALVQPDDPAALAQALLGLARDPAARDRLAAAGQVAVARFSWAQEKRKLLDLYQDLAG